MKLYNDSERFDGIFQMKDIDDSQEYGYSEVLQKIYNDLYTSGGKFKGEKGDPGTPATNGKDGTSVSVVNNTYTNPLDGTVIETPAHSASLNIVIVKDDKYFVILTNDTDTPTDVTWGVAKASAVKISGDKGADGFDGLKGADSTVPGPKGDAGKDGISWTTKALQFDTPDNQLVVPPHTTIIVFIKSTRSVATYTNPTDSDITTNTNVLVYISLKGDKGDSVKGDVGPQGKTSDVMNRAYTSEDFDEVITVTPKTILLLTARYTNTTGPHTQFGVYANNLDTSVDVTANLSNTQLNWNDLQGSKGLDSTVPGPKGDPGVGIKGDKGDPGQITSTVVLNLTNPGAYDTVNVNPYTVAFIFSITNSDKSLAIYNNNTSQTQTPTVGSLSFTSLLGKQGVQGVPGEPGKDSTVPGPASSIATAFLNNPTADSTVTTADHTTTIVYVTTTNSSGLVLSKMGSITNNSSKYITTKYSDINLTQVSSEQVIPEPGKNANVKAVTFNDLDTSKTFTAEARTAYLITNKVTSTGIVYFGTISNDTDSPKELSYSTVTFNRVSAQDGKDGKDGQAGKDGKDGLPGGVVEFIEGDSTAQQTVPARTKIQVFDKSANVIAVYVNDTDQEVTKAANFTFKPKGGSNNNGSAIKWTFDKPYYDPFWYQNFPVNNLELNQEMPNPIKKPQFVAPFIFTDTNAISKVKQDKVSYKFPPAINKLSYLAPSSNLYAMTNNNSDYGRTLTSSVLFNEFDNEGVDGKILFPTQPLSRDQGDAISQTKYNLRHNPDETFALMVDPISERYAKYETPIIHLGGDEDKVLTSKDFADINKKLNLTTNLSSLKSNYLNWLSGDKSTSVGNEFLVVLRDGSSSSIDLPFTTGVDPYTQKRNEAAYIVISKQSDKKYVVTLYSLPEYLEAESGWSNIGSKPVPKTNFGNCFSMEFTITSETPIVWETGNYTPGEDSSNLRLYVNSIAMSSTRPDKDTAHTLTIVKQTSSAPQVISYSSAGRKWYGTPFPDVRFLNNMAGWPVYSDDNDPLETNACVNVQGSLDKLNKMYSDNWIPGSDFVNEVESGSFIKSTNLGLTSVQGSLGNPYLVPWKFNISDQRAKS